MEVSFRDIFILIKDNLKTVVFVTFISSSIGIIYALVATPTYKADLYMVSTEKSATGLNGGGIQAIASQFGLGGNLDMSNSSTIYTKRVAMKILTSREFTLEFLEENNYYQYLYPNKWDSTRNKWREDIVIPNHELIIKTMNEVRTLSEDIKTGVLHYSMESPDPYFASEFLNNSVREINENIRSLSISDGTKNIKYLEQEIGKTNLVQAKNVLSAILQDEKQNLMIANTREDFAFKVIDKSIVPKQKFKPSRRTIALSSFFLGLLVSVFYLIIRNYRESEQV